MGITHNETYLLPRDPARRCRGAAFRALVVDLIARGVALPPAALVANAELELPFCRHDPLWDL